MIRVWLRSAYGLGTLLGRAGISPGAVTTAGLVLWAAVPLATATGPLGAVAAAGLVLLAGVLDSADGAVALVTGRATRLGAVYDSLADRVGEACWALAFWLLGAPSFLVLFCVGVCWLHEYARARATAAGMTRLGTVAAGERPTRIAVALVGLLLAGILGLLVPELAAGTATLVVAVWALLAVFGFSQLMSVVHSALP